MKTNRLAAFVLCATLLPICNAAHAKPKLLKATSENFVSLRLLRAGGIAGIREDYSIQNHTLSKSADSRSGGTGSRRAARVVRLSGNQWRALMKHLQKADILAAVGNYSNPGIADDITETLTLTLRDDQNHARQFVVVSDYDEKAPAPSREFIGYLASLIRSKGL